MDRYERVRRVRNTLSGGSREDLPTRIGKYTIVREVGRGGTATVYEATDPDLRRRVALKVLTHEAGPDVVAERLRREATILAQLSHPNIVPVHEVGTTSEGRPFIAMGFVHGATFAGLLQAGATTRRELVRMLEEVARAVAHAHVHGIVHRDLKPGNVLVDGSGRAMLTDFGLARTEWLGARLTQSQAIMGTPHYMAPEQVDGRTKEIDARTDVYALGVMLYEAITGRTPYVGDTPARLFVQILQHDPPVPSRIATVDRDLDAICRKAMEKERDRRYASAGALAEDLARWRRGEPVQARAPGALAGAARVVRRHPALLALRGLVTKVALVAGSVEASRTRIRRARLEEAQVNFERARLLFDEFEQGYRSPPRDLSGGVALLGQALARLDEALSAAPDLVEGHHLRGHVHERLRRLDAAHADYTRTLAAQPQHVHALIDRGRLRVEQLRARYFGGATPVDESIARQDLEAAAATVRDPALTAYVRALLELARGRPATAADAARAARGSGRMEADFEWLLCHALVAQGQRAEAVEVLRRLIAREPGNPEPYRMTLHLCRYEGLEPGRMLELIDVLRVMEPGDPAHLVSRGQILLSLGRWDEAIASYSDVIERHPQEASGFIARGIAFFERGDPALRDSARHDLDRGIELDPSARLAHHARARLREGDGDWTGAIEDYTRALKLHPEFHIARQQRGNALLRTGDYASAIADFDALIGGPYARSAPPFHGRGIARLVTGDLAGALADFDRTLELDAAHENVRGRRAVVLARLGRAEEASAEARRAMERAPNRPASIYGLAEALLASGDAAEAEGLAARAAESIPEARLTRARALERLGRTADACAEARRFLHNAPPAHADRREAENLLKRLEQ